MILKIHNIILHIELEKEFSTPVDGLIVSDDINLIMRQTDTIFQPKKSSPKDWKKIITEANRMLPKKLGSKIITHGKEAINYGKGFPVAHLFIAVVYDFDLKPPCQEKFVKRALKGCFKKAVSLKITNLALNPIGCAQKGISLKSFTQILSQLCLKHIKTRSSLKNIFLLLASEEERYLIIEYLSSLKAIQAIMPLGDEKQNISKM